MREKNKDNKQILSAPKIIKDQNTKLISSYKNPKRYTEVLRETVNLFNTHPQFILMLNIITDWDKKYIENIILNILPSSFDVSSLSQLMAIIFANNPYL